MVQWCRCILPRIIQATRFGYNEIIQLYPDCTPVTPRKPAKDAASEEAGYKEFTYLYTQNSTRKPAEDAASWPSNMLQGTPNDIFVKEKQQQTRLLGGRLYLYPTTHKTGKDAALRRYREVTADYTPKTMQLACQNP